MTEQQLECMQNFFNATRLSKSYSETERPEIKIGPPILGRLEIQSEIPAYRSSLPTIGVDLGNIDASKEIGMLQGHAYAKREMENTQAQQRVNYIDTNTATQVVRYIDEDIKQTAKMCKEMLNMRFGKYFEIQKVMFNAPATIVFCMDGTKTVVKAQKGDKFDLEKGLAMAFAKRALGDKGNYYNVFRKHLPKSKVLKSTAGRKKTGKNTTTTQKTAKESAGRLIVDKDGSMKLVNKPEVSPKISRKTGKEG